MIYIVLLFYINDMILWYYTYIITGFEVNKKAVIITVCACVLVSGWLDMHVQSN